MPVNSPKVFLHKGFYARRMQIRKNGEFVSKTPDHRDFFVKIYMAFCLTSKNFTVSTKQRKQTYAA